MIKSAKDLKVGQEIFVVRSLQASGIERHTLKSFRDGPPETKTIWLEFSDIGPEYKRMYPNLRYATCNIHATFESAKNHLFSYFKSEIKRQFNHIRWAAKQYYDMKNCTSCIEKNQIITIVSA